MSFRTEDFESSASAVSPPRHKSRLNDASEPVGLPAPGRKPAGRSDLLRPGQEVDGAALTRHRRTFEALSPSEPLSAGARMLKLSTLRAYSSVRHRAGMNHAVLTSKEVAVSKGVGTVRQGWGHASTRENNFAERSGEALDLIGFSGPRLRKRSGGSSADPKDLVSGSTPSTRLGSETPAT